MEHTEIFNIVQQEAMKRPARYNPDKTKDDIYQEIMVVFMDLISPDIQHAEVWGEAAYLAAAMGDGLIDCSDPRLNEFQQHALKLFYNDGSFPPDAYLDYALSLTQPEISAFVYASAITYAKFTEEEIRNFREQEPYRSYINVRRTCLGTASKALARYVQLTFNK